MKHISHLTWSALALVFNPKEKILLNNIYRERILLAERQIQRDKNHTKWRRQHDLKNLNVELMSVEFVNLLDAHGYDTYDSGSSTDVDMRSAAFRQLNELSKAQAIAEKYTTYTKYADNAICRCGDWFFCIHRPNVEEEIEINYDNVYASGGKRPGAGRKSQFGKLMNKETATIRVPAFEKEKIKALVEWLIDMEAEGRNIHTAICNARFALHNKNYKTEEDVKDSELLDDLHNHLPHFYIAKPEAEPET